MIGWGQKEEVTGMEEIGSKKRCGKREIEYERKGRKQR